MQRPIPTEKPEGERFLVEAQRANCMRTHQTASGHIMSAAPSTLPAMLAIVDALELEVIASTTSGQMTSSVLPSMPLGRCMLREEGGRRDSQLRISPSFMRVLHVGLHL